MQNNAFNETNIKCQVHLNQLGAKQGKWAVNRKRSVLMRKEQEERGG